MACFWPIFTAYEALAEPLLSLCRLLHVVHGLLQENVEDVLVIIWHFSSERSERIEIVFWISP